MSRYSRNFDDKTASPANVRGFPTYTRYREAAKVSQKLACHICDGAGGYAGADGPIVCDVCEGSGVLRAGELQEVALFRTRNKDGQ